MSNKQLKQEERKYLNEVRSYFISDQGTRNKFIHDLKSDIDGFIEENSVTDFKAVYDRFGDPQAIARAFFDHADIKSIKRKMDIKRAIIIAIIIALVMFGICLTVNLIDAHQDYTGRIETELGEAEYGQIGIFDLGG